MPGSRYSSVASVVTILLLSLLPPQAQTEEMAKEIAAEVSNIQGREKPIQLTAHALTIIRKEEIEATYRRDIESLEFLVPGMVVDPLSAVPNGAAISIRGLSSSDIEINIDPAVALLIDGVFVGSHQGQNALLFDLEKIEITRGIQAAYRGPTGIAGAINLVRSKPTGHMDSRYRIALAANNRQESDFVVNFPSFAGVAIKVAGHLIEGDGDYMYNHTRPQRSENEDDHTQASLSVLWQATASLNLQYTFDAEWDKADTPALLNISGEGDLLCDDLNRCGIESAPTGTKTGSRYQSTQNFSNNMGLDGYYHTLAMDLELGGFKITNTSSRRMTNEVVNQDLDASSIDFYSSTKAQNRHQLSNDLRVISPENDQLQYLAGYYYQEDRYRLLQADYFLPQRLVDYYTAISPGPPYISAINSKRSQQESKLQVLYGHIDLKVDERSSMDLGIRYSIRTMDFEHEPNIVENAPGSFYYSFAADEEWDKLTGSLGFTYKVDEASILYLRLSKGHRGGGYSASGFYPVAFQPERVESLEAGIKTSSEDGRLIFNLNAYQTKWDEKLETFITSENGDFSSSTVYTNMVTTNLSKVNIDGLEAELRARFFDTLVLRVSYSHISADYDKYSVADIANIATDPYARLNLSGYHPARAPANTYYLSLRNSWKLGPGSLGLYFAYRYTTDYQTNPLLSRAWVHNYGTTDLSLDYQWKSWTFRFFSTNLKNNRMVQNVGNYTDANLVRRDAVTTSAQSLSTSAEYNLPRYSGFEMRYEFSTPQSP